MAKFDWKKLYAPKTLKIALVAFVSLLAVLLVTCGILAFVPVSYAVEFDKNKDIKISYYNKEVGHPRELHKRDRNSEIDKILSLLESATKTNMLNKSLGINKAGNKNVEIITRSKDIKEETLRKEGAYIAISVQFPSSPASYIRLNNSNYLLPGSQSKVAILELIIQLEDIKNEWAPFSVYYKTPAHMRPAPDGATEWGTENVCSYKLNTWGNLYNLSKYIKDLRVESL